METLPPNRKRASPDITPPWRRPSKDHRRHQTQTEPRPARGDDATARKEQETFARTQNRLNQIQEAQQMAEWVSKEDEFVLKQAKKKARIRVKEGRAKIIDWLAATLSVIEPPQDTLEEEGQQIEVDIVDSSGLVEGLDYQKLQDLVKDIDIYLTLETASSNRKYWNALRVLCKDQLSRSTPAATHERSVSAVASDVDRLLGPKTLPELTTLERQISDKLSSNEPIDVEYWEQLLRNIVVYKSKAELDSIYKTVILGRLKDFQDEQIEEADLSKKKLSVVLANHSNIERGYSTATYLASGPSDSLDPEPQLKLNTKDKCLDVLTTKDFIDRVVLERRKILKVGYVPPKQVQHEQQSASQVVQPVQQIALNTSRFTALPDEDFSQATTALYEREVARGVQENEEIFAGEEEVFPSKPQWASKYRPRKPRYFNRVQMGYEWNKYNQTHYDHDNPPPKVVQGYKFNVFYPDLIDRTKAPTYRIERENGRKRGQSFAPAGEEDTCLIRFVSGPPYEDLAFRIVDKEWDYSAKRERGFRSSFDKGILQLHFQFKKVYYRK